MAKNRNSRPLRILHVSMELAPWAKEGGLADVLSGLPAAQQRAGDKPVVVVPRHGCGSWDESAIRPVPGGTLKIRLGRVEFPVELGRIEHPGGFDVILVRNDELFDREGIYHQPHASGVFHDALVRRSTLCHAALYYALRATGIPDVIHAHDAAAALTIPLLSYRFQPTPLQHARKVFSIHNLAYLEQHPLEALPYADLPLEEAYPMGPLEFWGTFSGMKAGIVLADRILTVSPTYAREIVEDPEIAGPMHGVIHSRRDALVGILNGVDRKVWNPATDRHLAAPYGAANLEPREACRKELLEMTGLDGASGGGPDGAPVVVGVVSRLVHQKALELLVEAIPALASDGFRFAVVGTGEPDLEDAFLDLSRRLPGRVWTALDPGEPVARKVFAGSDLFCVPSRYEPCGLTQQYALLYGSIPVVRRTGGLADTVDETVGFLFDELSPNVLAGTLRDAAGAVRDPDRRLGMQKAGMARGRSWDDVAAEIRERVYLGTGGGEAG
ncbi:MAG TPA: glycogen/starch synthase, partial [Candidatus Saccharimonadales bacterium]|nr:glycogen/starch synthase [Candidatus Saccharimonadales bacterium]